jgi:glycerol-3-phosphate dehydrogenase
LGLKTDDVLYCYQGLTPADDGDNHSTRLHHSRVIDHSASDGVDGLISLVSIKWTTARGVAERAVDAVMNKLSRSGACLTRTTPLPDALHASDQFAGLTVYELAECCQQHISKTMTMTLSDMLLRRTNDLVLGRLGMDEIVTVAHTMAEYYRWDNEQCAEQLNGLVRSGLPIKLKEQLVQRSIWGDP